MTTEKNSQTPHDLVVEIISSNPNFGWLWGELGPDFTFEKVEEVLTRYGYGPVYRYYKK